MRALGGGHDLARLGGVIRAFDGTQRRPHELEALRFRQVEAERRDPFVADDGGPADLLQRPLGLRARNAEQCLDAGRVPVGAGLARARHGKAAPVIGTEPHRDEVRLRLPLAAPPDIVVEALPGRLVDEVLVDLARERELDRVAQRALPDAVASADDGEAGAEIHALALPEAPEAAQFEVVEPHGASTRMRATSEALAAPRKAATAASGTSLNRDRRRAR